MSHASFFLLVTQAFLVNNDTKAKLIVLIAIACFVFYSRFWCWEITSKSVGNLKPQQSTELNGQCFCCLDSSTSWIFLLSSLFIKLAHRILLKFLQIGRFSESEVVFGWNTCRTKHKQVRFTVNTIKTEEFQKTGMGWEMGKWYGVALFMVWNGMDKKWRYGLWYDYGKVHYGAALKFSEHIFYPERLQFSPR